MGVTMMIWRGVLSGAGGRGRLRRRGVLVVVAAAVALVCAGLLTPAGSARAAGAARAAGTSGIIWGRAEPLRGRAPISGSSGSGQVVLFTSLSCWSVNNCVAGGRYFSTSGTTDHDFVVVEQDGRWGRAAPLPGIAALGTAGWVTAVSCASGGYCVAGGFYGDRFGHWQPFAATLTKGRWQKPLEVPGTKVRRHNAGVTALSCLTARRCVVAGDNDLGSFVARQVKGVWRTARILHDGAGSTVMSCWAARSCVVARAHTVSELKGVWGTPQAIPGATNDVVTALSCAHDGYCALAGTDNWLSYVPGPPFIDSGPDGTFGTASTLSGFQAGPVSCPSAGNCVMAGGSQVVSQTGGVWGTPEQLPGTAAELTINSLSCWSAGNCGAGGSYVAVAGGPSEPFVASEINGRWSSPEPVPGITALNKQNSSHNGVVSVSCPSALHCTAAGTYTDAHGRSLGFVTGPA
jgi:hypothetical protein